MKRLHDLVQLDCQFIIATHSPILLAYPGATILEVSPEGFAETKYEDTEHYRVVKAFLDNPARMLSILLS